MQLIEKIAEVDGYKKFRDFIHNITKCSSGRNVITPLKNMYVMVEDKKNHPAECHDPQTTCGSPYVMVQDLAVHYENARKVSFHCSIPFLCTAVCLICLAQQVSPFYSFSFSTLFIFLSGVQMFS